MNMQNKELPVPANPRFSEADLTAKKTLRAWRLHLGLTVPEAAEKLDVSTKQMEDMEAVRNYGVRITWELIVRASDVLGIPLAEFKDGASV